MFVYVMAFCFGAIGGSFANVAILRWGQDGSVLKPARSVCYTCKQPIAWHDNIPILSYFLLHGRCRNCGTQFSPRYAIIEALTALLCVGAAARFYPFSTFTDAAGNLQVAFDGTILFYFPVIVALVIVTFTDLDEMIIPNTVTYPGVVYGLLLALAAQIWPLGASLHVQQLFGTDTIAFWRSTYEYVSIDPLYGAAAGALPLYLMGVFGKMVFKKDAMGLGDVKMMAAMGTILGWRMTLLALFLGALFGAVVGLTLILTGKAALGRHIPFGPYLAVGSLLCLLFGNEMLNWYFDAILKATAF